MRVWPKNEEMRKLLKHPLAGGFAGDLATPTEWPDDQFTTRRIRDGDVLTEAPGAKKSAAEKPAAAPEEKPTTGPVVAEEDSNTAGKRA